MTPGARVAAAIEVMADVDGRRRPAADALKDWGLSHRFAGSKDRAGVAALVYDALRRRASAAYVMDDPSPRGVLVGALKLARGLSLEDAEALFSGEGHAPAQLSAGERARYADASLAGAPAPVAGDFPEWLEPSLRAAFGERLVEETAALAERAPLDLRVNTLKCAREKALASLKGLDPAPTPLSPLGLRIPFAPDGRAVSLSSEPDYLKGRVEIQDEGSQLAALLCAARAGEQVLDLCAGGGGKTLALAAAMDNRGQIYAHDDDPRRLAPIHARLERAGVRNVQIRTPRRGADVLADLEGRCDLVLIDAPCTGIGAWRRNPDAKWRLRPGALEQRILAQDALLREARRFLKDGGRLAYVTCSLLREENEDRVAAFLAAERGFAPVGAQDAAERAGLPGLARFASTLGPGFRFSPAASGTDGFYAAILARG
ncbi:RsmB/NOP family class I SAM-dependent RNA methyltransferase [Methylocella sp.]|uniref:RsmB/NOP family class I SAM-dependent RNA methyltransferase n=1 Tax=Methylocella sp. TaxID=1978226 RepID=UPI00378452F8